MDAATPALSGAYKEQVRPCLDIIDGLRFDGLTTELKLPSIAVIGDQSVGKSSVLESISGIQLPRGTGIVTRCPLQLQLRSSDDAGWNAKIRYRTLNGKVVENNITDPKDVESEIRKAQELMTKDEKDVSDEAIELMVESHDSPNLTLIDLPGIARFNKDGGDRILTITRGLITKYIERAETIILVVIPCHTDVETIEALQMAKKVDPNSDRTMGVLTFPDLVNKGAEGDVMDVVNNTKIPLKKGYIMVKCRTQEDINCVKPLEESVRDEHAFFTSHPFYRQLEESKFGTHTLGMKLSRELYGSIKKSIPDMLRTIRDKLEKLEKQLKDMGDLGSEDDTDRRRRLLGLLSRFTTDFQRVTNGDHLHHDKELRLFAICRGEFESLADSIAGEHEDQWFEDNPHVREYIVQELQHQKGKEFPSEQVTHPVVERVVRNEFLNSIRPLIDGFVNNINAQVAAVIEKMARNIFQSYPNLESAVKNLGSDIRKQMLEKCELDIAKLLVQEEFVWTQDNNILKLQEEYQIKESNRGQGIRANPSEETLDTISLGSNSSGKKLDSKSKKLFRRKKSSKGTLDSDYSKFYHEEVVMVDRKLPVAITVEPFDESTETVIRLVKVYIKVAIQRISDSIPLCVIYHLLIQLSENMTVQVLDIVSEKDVLENLFEDDPSSMEKRAALVSKIEKMKNAQKELMKIP